jgi:hypothetical protein
MIWFACRQCGKVHGRSENSSGTLVFCECGQGNPVPWESTAAAPEPAVVLDVGPTLPESRAVDVGAAAPPPPPIPVMRPVPVSEEKVPPGPDRRRRPQPDERGGPGYCFHHPRVQALGACDSCKETFCSGCLVTLDGQRLCGPCKNHALRHIAEAPRLSGQSLGAVLTAAGGVALLLLLVLASPSFMMATFALILLLPMGLACTLGWNALSRPPVDGREAGRSLALMGIVGGVFGSALALIVVATYWLQWA